MFPSHTENARRTCVDNLRPGYSELFRHRSTTNDNGQRYRSLQLLENSETCLTKTLKVPAKRSTTECTLALAHTQKGISHPMETISRHFSILAVFRVIFNAGFGASACSAESPHFSLVKVFQSSAILLHFQELIFSRNVKFFVENKYSNETCHYSKTSISCCQAV